MATNKTTQLNIKKLGKDLHNKYVKEILVPLQTQIISSNIALGFTPAYQIIKDTAVAILKVSGYTKEEAQPLIVKTNALLAKELIKARPENKSDIKAAEKNANEEFKKEKADEQALKEAKQARAEILNDIFKGLLGGK